MHESSKNNAIENRFSLGLAIALVAFLLVVGLYSRGYLWYVHDVVTADPISFVRRIIFFSYYDFIVLTFVTSIFFLLVWVAAKLPSFAGFIKTTAIAYTVLHAALLITNIIAVEQISTPLTIQWLYYFDLGRSITPQMAVGSVLNFKSVSAMLVGILLGLFVFFTAKKLGHWSISLVLILVITVPVITFSAKPPKRDAYRDAVSNPISTIASSANAALKSDVRNRSSSLVDDSYHVGKKHEPTKSNSLGLERPNILVIVLESVSAKAVYERKKVREELTNIRKLSENGIVFTNFYTPVAQSTRAIFAMLTSRYPVLGFRPETSTLAKEQFTTNANLLAQNGYQTAFFMGGEFAFQGVDSFLEGKGFQKLVDVENAGCGQIRLGQNPKLKNISGIPTPCLFDNFVEWQRTADQRPYFAILWANDTHFPYFPENDALTKKKEKYAAAVQDVDKSIGELMGQLSKSGKLDNTVVIITSDHGEAFGEHGNVMHGTTIYEEEVHIPLIISHPSIGRQQTIDSLTSLIDLPPLTADLAALPPDPSWQGASPLRLSGKRNLYFAANLKRFLSGVRIGQFKYTLDQQSAEISKVNLIKDPMEKDPTLVESSEKENIFNMIAAWAQYNDNLYER